MRPGQGCLRACVLFTIAATVGDVMSDVRKAATLAVDRQITVLFTAAQTSQGALETHPCCSCSRRKSPVWKVIWDYVGSGMGRPAQSECERPWHEQGTSRSCYRCGSVLA